MLPGFGPKPPANEPEPEWTLVWELDEPENKVENWRFEKLKEAGWGHMDAVRLAMDLTVDLHRACEILRGGCDPDTALDILT